MADLKEPIVTITLQDGSPLLAYPRINCSCCGCPCDTAKALNSSDVPGTFCGEDCLLVTTSNRATAMARAVAAVREATTHAIGSYATRQEIAEHIPARRWTGTLSDWRELIEERRPCAVSAEDIVRKLAVAYGVAPAPEGLALALFRTDPDVIAFVDRVADESIRKVVTKWNAVTMRADIVVDMWEGYDHAKVDRAVQIAWDRDENGWRTRAEKRAAAMAEVLA